ncbi:hypothetical protein V474_19865 [Novosphingobium barchaimii LL02]|uniref:Uncharacterized protein n=1 Tax=Novosphingobium barchaimii LL02 TaxID=1114963 RepID=A0A0J8AKY5_9SPHN|nr:hypothetical protein [Novosphingobium barchaimii]KMS55295.1 hypothetical protein V474_19865 [Novosphingobium barchaimii LL02]
MSRYMQDASAGRGEGRCNWLTEMELAERAHVLKMLARELGQDTAPAIAELAKHGLDAALAVLAVAVGTSVSDAYLRQRALWRAGQSLS